MTARVHTKGVKGNNYSYAASMVAKNTIKIRSAAETIVGVPGGGGTDPSQNKHDRTH